LPEKAEEAAPFLPPEIVPSRQMRQCLLKWTALVIGLLAIFYAGQFAWQKLRPTKISDAPFLTQNVNDLTASFIAPEGALRQGNNELLIEFRDRNGQLVDVGTVDFKIDMNMPGMQMHGAATVERTRTTGQYHGKIRIDMAGDWSARISYDGPRGHGETSFSITAR